MVDLVKILYKVVIAFIEPFIQDSTLRKKMLNFTALQASIKLPSEILNLDDNIFVFLESDKSILSLHGRALDEMCDVVEVPKAVFLGVGSGGEVFCFCFLI